MNRDFFAKELELMRENYKQNPPKMLLKDNVLMKSRILQIWKKQIP